ncbi:stage II sporulation protein D [Flavonifractor sp. An306]|uniref:stage II sporulation protein D n=1 Tax=Flavonifractor sp. An306 TaxID=1965629 RepID=UPI00260350A1|nr:stage II sporulation protein D [Flavonifractor sp. An306]
MKNNLQNYGQRWGVKQVVATALALLLVLFLLPLLLFGTGGLEQTEQAAPTGELPIDRTVVTPSPSADSQTQIRVALTDGSVLTLGLDQYLWRVVAAEMPASFELEALKAQAAAARTYTLSKLGRTVEKHPDADVCTDITCCQAYIDPDQAAANWGDNAAAYTAKITSAVSETDGMAVLYDGQPIQAVFFSSAAGRTVDAVEVWGNSVPYLTGVDSPEGDEVPNYHSTVTFTPEEFKSKLLAQYPDADLSGDPAGWFQNTVPNSAGGVEQVDVGGVTVSGGALRTLLGLRSTSFTVTAGSQGVTFSVTGYGHGVGMSQYGANALAKQGKTYDEILKWYYTGVEVAPYMPGG